MNGLSANAKALEIETKTLKYSARRDFHRGILHLYDFFGKIHTMPSPIVVTLEPGAVVRTRDLANLSDNPSRLAKRLLREGRLKRLTFGGLFYVPRRSRFGMVGPDMVEVLEVFLNGGPFVETGPPIWNTVSLWQACVPPAANGGLVTACA